MSNDTFVIQMGNNIIPTDMGILRPSTIEFKKINAKIGVEVGVALGHNSRSILTHLPEVTLIGVDNNYLNYNDSSRKMLQEFEPRFFLYESDSANASMEFFDETIDFVYIDADHHSIAVLRDIDTWYPKIRKGGIVAGHDFEKLGRLDNENVQDAVLYFTERHKLQVHCASIIGEPGEMGHNRMDWWFFKE